MNIVGGLFVFSTTHSESRIGEELYFVTHPQAGTKIRNLIKYFSTHGTLTLSSHTCSTESRRDRRR